MHCASTQIVATSPEGIDANVAVVPSPAGILSKLRDWIHRDIRIDDPAFDPALLVTAEPASAAKVLLASASLREKLLALGGRLAGMQVEKNGVTVALNGVETDPEVLQVGLDIAVEAARWQP